MKSVKRIIGILVVLAVVIAIAITSGMVKKTPEAIQKMAIGKVNGTDITVADISKQMQSVYQTVASEVQGNPMDNAQGKKYILQAREQAVNNIINEKIAEQQIAAEKITVTQQQIDDAYNQQVDEFIKQAGGDKEKGTQAFDQALQQAGYANADAFKADIKTSLEDQALIKTITDKVPKVTEADAQTYYNENKSQYTKPAGAQVYQIVVDSQAEADKLRNEYLEETKGMTNVQDKLAVFKKLATANNVDSTKSTGGSLGYIDYNSTTYVPAFIDAVKSLKQAGDVSAVVNSKTSSYSVYNIIFVSEVNAEPTVQPFADANKDDAIVQKLQQEKNQQAVTAQLDAWRKAAGAEVYTSKLDYPVPTTSTSASTSETGSTSGN